MLKSLFPGATPSEAWGIFRGAEFYFYARFNHWGFAISHDPEVDPCVLLDIEDTQASHRSELFVERAVNAHEGAFIRTCYPYGNDEFAASYMPKEEIARILRRCLSEYAAEYNTT